MYTRWFKVGMKMKPFIPYKWKHLHVFGRFLSPFVWDEKLHFYGLTAPSYSMPSWLQYTV